LPGAHEEGEPMTNRWRWVGLALVAGLVISMTGCKKPVTAPAPTAAALVTPPTQGNPLSPSGGGNVFNPPNNGGVGAAGMDVKRTAYKTQAKNNLYQVTKMWLNDALINNAPPDRNAFLQSLRQSLPQAYEGIQDGAYVLVSDARPAASVVICYEKDPDRGGIHFAAFGDNSVQNLTTDQLRTALQVK